MQGGRLEDGAGPQSVKDFRVLKSFLNLLLFFLLYLESQRLWASPIPLSHHFHPPFSTLSGSTGSSLPTPHHCLIFPQAAVWERFCLAFHLFFPLSSVRWGFGLLWVEHEFLWHGLLEESASYTLPDHFPFNFGKGNFEIRTGYKGCPRGQHCEHRKG